MPHPVIKETTRWIFFLPAAIVAMVLASYATYGVTWLFWSVDPSRAEIFMRTAAQGLAQGAAFVFVGATVAPRAHRHVAFSLAGAQTVVTLILLAWAYTHEKGWDAILECVCVIAGAFISASAGEYRSETVAS